MDTYILVSCQRKGAVAGSQRIPLYWIEGYIGGVLFFSSPCFTLHEVAGEIREAQEGRDLPVVWQYF